MLKIVRFLCLFVVVSCAEVLNEEISEQSFLYATALTAQIDRFNNTVCRQQLKEFVDGITVKKLWALKMLDASGQEVPGYLFGHTLWLNSFSQCRDVPIKRGLFIGEDQPFPENAYPPYKTEFMTAAFTQNNTMQFQTRTPSTEFLHIGLCMPETCTPKEVELYLKSMLERKMLTVQNIYPLRMNVSGVKSLRPDRLHWMNDTIIVITMIILIATVILCLAGTWYDVKYYQPYMKFKQELETKNIVSNDDVNIHIKPPSLFGRILLCYSFHTNIRAIFTVSYNHDPNSNSLPFIHGIKTWFMLYIMLLHTVLFQNFFTENAHTVYRLAAMFVNQILSNSSYSVDTYFCLGGFLVSYLFYKSRKGKKPFKFIQGIKIYTTMIIHRYIRLTPAYAVILLISYSLWQLTINEYPLIHKIELEQVENACSTYWWRNLLYISTFFSRKEMCLSWTWYLSDDMQFYVVNCLLILISTAYVKPALYTLGLLPIISVVCGAATSYIHKYVPTLEEQIVQLEIIYDPFLIRMGPYFVGVLAGYYINKWDKKIPLQKKTINIISYLCFLMAIYIIHGVYGRDILPNTYIAIYTGLSRTLWGVCIAWLLMTCTSGDAGSVNKFFSLPYWVPISRVTYCLYLVHPIIIILFGYTGDKGVYMSYPTAVQSSVGIFAFSFFLAVIISLMFESPYILLLKLILGKVLKKEMSD